MSDPNREKWQHFAPEELTVIVASLERDVAAGVGKEAPGTLGRLLLEARDAFITRTIDANREAIQAAAGRPEKIGARMSAEDWKLILFLVGRGALHEFESYLLNGRAAHRRDCVMGFVDVYERLMQELPPACHPTKPSQDTPRPLPTSPTTE